MQQKILLVDDREDNLLSMEAILEPDGYQFIKATSGRHALKILLTEFDFALILMDVKMPNLSGFETAALIYEREKLRHIPIIFITANNYGEDNIFKGYRTGAVDYIYKPINPELLRAKVSVFIDLYQKNRRLLMQEQKLKAINKNLEDEISERKASEEKIKQLNRQLLGNITLLESANRDLDRFAFMASHDLQEPLRKIRTFSDLLATKYKDSLDKDANAYIDRIQSAAARMQALIKDILAFSKLTGEKDNFEFTDLNILLDEALADLETPIKEKGAHISLLEPLPALEVNPGLIRPLFYNIISNAIKYSKTDVTPQITIRYELTTGQEKIAGNNKENAGKYCRIFMEDNGIGFDQVYAEQVFEMFRRLHVSSAFEGTGIGLALCKKIVEKHHGFISAHSKANEGTTFIVTLPVYQPVKVMMKQ
ncbi:hybrid sensor histidine kinase/response regulator [Paraflavitalea soli]|uniref:histidine kinase n=1 Tax=Paraflavitalea soli TaxID=2315862 RepID=A0A3B7MI22_9BACT|nr:response regulator [Paraflavitalea soli]AXY72686.1 hybrid sensor histidine kinase/response regulator [Paraflavitalea soli]